MSIPNKLFIFWHDLDDCPGIIKTAINTTIQTYADYEITLADDDYMEQFLINNYSSRELNLYKLNRIAASRSDLARVLLLHHFGGIYIDASMAFHRKIDLDKFQQEEVVLVEKEKQTHNLPGDLHIINGILIGKKNAALFSQLITDAFNNLSEGTYNYNVSWATGPKLLTRTIQRWNKYLNNELIILSFSQLKAEFFVHMRKKGVITTTWLDQQLHGIISIDYYSKAQRQRWGDYPGYINGKAVTIF